MASAPSVIRPGSVGASLGEGGPLPSIKVGQSRVSNAADDVGVRRHLVQRLQKDRHDSEARLTLRWLRNRLRLQARPSHSNRANNSGVSR